MKILLILLGILWPVLASAQVQADRIVHGSDIVPRSGSVLNVPTLSPGTYDVVEYEGTLTLQPGTYLVYGFLGLPGSVLNAGPGVEIVTRDIPPDPVRDPQQWFPGIVSFGHAELHGTPKASWSQSDALPAGASSAVVSLPGALPGDRLLIPDTRPINYDNQGNPLAPGRESPLSITSAGGASVTFSKGLDFAHPADGVRPYIANLSRDLIIRSENPNGTRGHVAIIGHDASFDIQYVQFQDLGRTRNEPCGVGNQCSRYSFHAHHMHDASRGSMLIGSSGLGHPQSKWGFVIHQSNGVLVEDVVCTDFPGACVVTEDGNEVDNIFRNIVSAYATGNGSIGAGDVATCAGCEGSGFWFRGLRNHFDGLVALNSNVAGINLIALNPPAPLPIAQQVPLSFVDNVAAFNQRANFEQWEVVDFDNVRLTAVGAGLQNVMLTARFPQSLRLIDPLVKCSGTGQRQTGIHSAAAYVRDAVVDGGLVAGCQIGLNGGGGHESLRLTGDLVMRNTRNVTFTDGQPLVFHQDADVRHEPFGANPPRFLVFSGAVWAPGQPTPHFVDDSVHWGQSQGSQYRAENWQGTGVSYQFFSNQSLENNPVWPAPGTGYQEFQPPASYAGRTMGEVWQELGLAFRGEALKVADAVTLTGVVNGKARVGLVSPLGPPRVVVTSVVPRQGGQPGRRVNALRTGDPAGTNGLALISIDGGPQFTVQNIFPNQGVFRDEVSFDITSAAYLTQGLHYITASRLSSGSPSVPLNPMTFCYGIGVACTEAPPPPPPPNVDCVMSAWSLESVGPWSAIVNGQQSRSEVWRRTVVTPASGTGLACPADTMNGSRVATVSPSNGPGLP